MPTSIHEIVERYMFKPPIGFAFVTMGLIVENSCNIVIYALVASACT